MSTGQDDPGAPGGRQPTEEELRAAYEAEIAKVTVEQILLEHVVTLINLGMRRTGLVAGTESERDPTQVRIAIEAIRAQLPLVEQAAPNQIAPIREALSQLQLAYVRIGGTPGPPTPEASPGPADAPPGPASSQAPPPDAPKAQTPPAGGRPEPPQPKPGEPGPAQRSGRLWVPGQ